jgi:hypothetical protein
MIKQFNENNNNDTPLLTNAVKQKITDLYIAGNKTALAIHHAYIKGGFAKTIGVLPTRSQIKYSLSRKKLVSDWVYRYLQGSIIIQEEVSHFDEESGTKIIDTPKEYNAIPSTVTELKNAAKSHFTNCTVGALEYFIDKLIDYSKADGTGDLQFLIDNLNQ